MKVLIVILLSFFAVSCSSTPEKSPANIPGKSTSNQIGHRESGIASFYAAKYQSRKTASGERLNQQDKTAAHRSLPFGTKVRVTNTDNGKSVIVKINDRGPYIKGRIIDLTQSAFSEIGDKDLGTISVTIEVVD